MVDKTIEILTEELIAATTAELEHFLAKIDSRLQMQLLQAGFNNNIDPRRFAAQVLTDSCAGTLSSFAARANTVISL